MFPVVCAAGEVIIKQGNYLYIYLLNSSIVAHRIHMHLMGTLDHMGPKISESTRSIMRQSECVHVVRE